MKKTWENPTIETVEISETSFEWFKFGNDTGCFDVPLVGDQICPES